MANEQENKALKLSGIGSLFMALLGFYFAWQASSDAILLDGVFSLVNLAMAILTLQVAKRVQQPPTSDFQFGLGQLEPMLNLFKGFIFLGVIIMAMFSAINSLASGGRNMAFGPAIDYATVALLGCLVFAFTIRHYAKMSNSGLLDVETKGWFIDSALSGAVLVTFIIGHSIKSSQFSWLTPYVDPGMVLCMCLLMLPVPFIILKSNLFDLLLNSPSKKSQQQLDQLLEVIIKKYSISHYNARYIKTSRSTFAHIFIFSKSLSPKILDKIRAEYLAQVQQLNIDVELVLEVSAKDDLSCEL